MQPQQPPPPPSGGGGSDIPKEVGQLGIVNVWAEAKSTRYGSKTKWTIEFDNGWKGQRWTNDHTDPTGQAALSLKETGPVNVVYHWKPASDPQYGPDMIVDAISPLTGGVGAATPAQAVGAQLPQPSTPTQTQQLPPTQAVQQTAPMPPAPEDRSPKQARGAAAKVAMHSMMMLPPADDSFWTSFYTRAGEIARWIETGERITDSDTAPPVDQPPHGDDDIPFAPTILNNDG